jgi:hypothetical protein
MADFSRSVDFNFLVPLLSYRLETLYYATIDYLLNAEQVSGNYAHHLLLRLAMNACHWD